MTEQTPDPSSSSHWQTMDADPYRPHPRVTVPRAGDDTEAVVARALDEHKYEVHGVCACGTDLEAKHGQYKVAWRAHASRHIAAAVIRAAQDNEQARAWDQGFATAERNGTADAQHQASRAANPYRQVGYNTDAARADLATQQRPGREQETRR